MAKKAVVGIAGAVLLGVFLFGSRFFGYIGTGVDNVRQAAKDSVPFELNLAEAKKKVASLDGVMVKLKRSIATLETDVDGINEEIVNREKNSDQQLAEMQTLANLVRDRASDTEYVSIKAKDETKKYTVAEVKKDLVRRHNSYETGLQALDTKKKTREAQKEQLDQLRNKLDQTVALKEKLELQIKELEAKKTSLEARKAAESVKFDDSEISEAQGIIDELEKDLKVQEKMINMETGSGPGRIKVDVSGEESVDILQKIDKASQGKNVKPADHELISIER